jgi:hypothetical protein
MGLPPKIEDASMPQLHHLSLNGLVVPSDFPTTPFEKIHARLIAKVDTQGVVYREYAGAWNAVSYRFLAATHYSDEFTNSMKKFGSSAASDERYRQERSLFGFFTNGLSAIEATFYGLFAIGAFLSPSSFRMMTAKEQQSVTPGSTQTAYIKNFSKEPILKVFDQLLSDQVYTELKHIRNVLAHRAAPGRKAFVSLGDSELLPEEWKLLNISMDDQLTDSRRAELARLLTMLLLGTQAFVEAKF